MPDERAPLTESEQEKLIALAMLTAKCRAAVDREAGTTHEIVLIPGAESPTRLVKQFVTLLGGLDAIGLDRESSWKLIEKTALDTMPLIRQRVLRRMLAVNGEATTSQIATALDYPATTTRRAMEDLTCYGVLTRESGGSGKADNWSLTEWTWKTYGLATTVPQMWQGVYTCCGA